MDRSKAGREKRDLLGIVRQLQLAWQLWHDKSVPIWTKLVPLLGLAYVVVPFDLVADPILGLGQLDDLGVMLLAIKLFLSLCPAALVAQYQQHLNGTGVRSQPEDDVIDATYRVVDAVPSEANSHFAR